MAGRSIVGVGLWLVLASAGCRSSGGDPAPDAASQTESASHGDPLIPSLMELTDPALSVLSRTSDGCVWKRIDPVSGDTRTAATLPPCEGLRIAWSNNHRHGDLWFVTPDGAPARLMDIGLESGRKLDLAPPPAGTVIDVGYSPENVLTALVVVKLVVSSTGLVEFEGERFQAPPGATGVQLAIDYVLSPSGWKRHETKLGTADADPQTLVRTLASHATLSPRSRTMLASMPDGDPVPKDAPVALALTAAAPEANGSTDGWRKLRTTAETYLRVADGPTARVLVIVDGHPTPLPGAALGPADAAAVHVRGKYLLVTTREGGKARLWDLDAKRVVFSDDSAVLALFWPPLPPQPQEAEPPPPAPSK